MKKLAKVLLCGVLFGLQVTAMAESNDEFLKRTGNPKFVPRLEDLGGFYFDPYGKKVSVPPAEYKKSLVENFNNYDSLHGQDGISYRADIVEIIKEHSYYFNDESEKEVFFKCLEGDRYFNVRAACAGAVGYMNYKDGKNRVRNALTKEKNVYVKLAMAEALINLEDKSAPEIYGSLGEILSRKNSKDWDFGYLEKTDPDTKGGTDNSGDRMIEEIRARAAKILARGEKKMAKEVLKTFQNDTNQAVRTESRRMGLLP